MTLTKEQKELIERNRRRALELKKKRQEKLKEEEAKKRANATGEESVPGKRQKVEKTNDKESQTSNEVLEKKKAVLEDFEMGASNQVSKREAVQMYCLPEGTLAVCSYVEKPNPRHKSWTPMKLYDRDEIRRRAHERYGGIEGLQRERRKRQQKRLERDLRETKDIFKK